jgi:hypothetical protein
MSNLRRLIIGEYKIALLLGCTLVFGIMVSCASELPGSLRMRKFEGEPLDVKKLNYVDLQTGAEVNVGKYMEANGLSHMLLMFGSIGCVKCNEKGLDLTRNFLRSHSLFLGEHKDRFALMGVTTDKGGGLTKFMARWRDPEQREKYGYSYVHWVDGEGETVKKYFLPKGEIFQVPFTVLLSKEGIVYRVLAQQSLSVSDILDQVETILDGGRVPTSGPSASPSAEPTSLPSVVPSPSAEPTANPSAEPTPPRAGLHRWKLELADRFARVEVSGCRLQSPANLDSLMPNADVRILHLIPSACGESCRHNLEQFRQIEADCRAASGVGNAQRCSVTHLALNEHVAEICEFGEVYAAGQDFVEGFADHFDWERLPDLDPATGAPGNLPEQTEPMVVGFFPSGKMILAHEGKVNADSLRSELGSPNLAERPRGPDFKLIGDDKTGAFVGDVRFSQTLQDAEFTIVGGFDVGCFSCVEELKHWSHPYNPSKPQERFLMEYCANSNGFCQVLALETYPSLSGTAQQMYESIKPVMQAKGIRIPLLVDAEKFEGEFSRFFEAHLTPKFPEWDDLPGTVVYDREGKIVVGFRSAREGEENAVMDTIKYLHAVLRPAQ